ncbi:hypothetical protein D3C74_297690 [compost metagenome]
MVDVDPGHVDRPRRAEVVDRGLQAVGPAGRPVEVEVLREELVVARVLAHDLGLPAQVLVDQPAAVAVERCAERAVDRAAHVGEVLPRVDAVGPVVEPVRLVERAEVVVEQRAQVLDERALHRGRRGVVELGLVVELEADDRGVLRRVVHERTDDALGVQPERGVRDVHDLARAVAPAARARLGEHLGVGRDEPRGHGVGRGADDHVEPGAGRGVESAVDVREVQDPGLGLERAPRRLGDADHGVPGLGHHRRVRGDAVVRQVLVVVGRAVEDLVHLSPFVAWPVPHVVGGRGTTTDTTEYLLGSETVG